MPVGGYAPGQTLNLDFDLNNGSDVNFSSFTVQLVKQITYHIVPGSSRNITEHVIVVEHTADGCSMGERKSYQASLLVPPIPPTDDSLSNICRVKYFMRVLGPTGWWIRDARFCVIVVIGTKPLYDSNTPQVEPTSKL